MDDDRADSAAEHAYFNALLRPLLEEGFAAKAEIARRRAGAFNDPGAPRDRASLSLDDDLVGATAALGLPATLVDLRSLAERRERLGEVPGGFVCIRGATADAAGWHESFGLIEDVQSDHPTIAAYLPRGVFPCAVSIQLWRVRVYPNAADGRLFAEWRWDPIQGESWAVRGVGPIASQGQTNRAREALAAHMGNLRRDQPGPRPETAADARRALTKAVESIAGRGGAYDNEGGRRAPQRNDLAGELLCGPKNVDRLLHLAGWSMADIKRLHAELTDNY